MRHQITLAQTLSTVFLAISASVISAVVSVGAATATTEAKQEYVPVSVPSTATISQPSGVTVDLTSVVVAALTLGFGYGVLRTFQNSGNSK